MGFVEPWWPTWRQEVLSSLTLGRSTKCAPFPCWCSRLRQSLPPDPDSSRPLSGMWALFRFPFWQELQSLPCRVMRGEGIQSCTERARSKVVRVFSTHHCLGLSILRKVRGMRCEGIPVACRPRPNVPSRVSTGDRLNFVDCDSKSWQRSPPQCLCRSMTFLVSIPVG